MDFFCGVFHSCKLFQPFFSLVLSVPGNARKLSTKPSTPAHLVTCVQHICHFHTEVSLGQSHCVQVVINVAMTKEIALKLLLLLLAQGQFVYVQGVWVYVFNLSSAWS